MQRNVKDAAIVVIVTHYRDGESVRSGNTTAGGLSASISAKLILVIFTAAIIESTMLVKQPLRGIKYGEQGQ